MPDKEQEPIMIKSMTGYGKAESGSDSGSITVEIRSVNHRYAEIFTKLPRTLLQFENSVRKCIGERAKRGKIEAFVQYEINTTAGLQLEPDVGLAKAYFAALETIRTSLGMEAPVPLSLVASQKDVLIARENKAEDVDLEERLLATVRLAVENLDTMRQREGALLFQDLTERRVTLGRLIVRIAERAPSVVSEYAEKLKERVRQLSGDIQVDELRLAQEVAMMADRSDITEELVRFNSHLQQFDEILLVDEPVGRKLDFLMQELNREINTIGSKANDADIASLVVQVKAELERIREQVQNIE